MRRMKVNRLKFTGQKDLFRQCVGLVLVKGIYSQDYVNHLKTLSVTALREEIRSLKDSYAS